MAHAIQVQNVAAVNVKSKEKNSLPTFVFNDITNMK